MIYIKVPNMNDSMSKIVINGVNYHIRFTYNERYDYWSFGIYDDESNPIIAMTRVVPNFPLFIFFTDTDLPNGEFGCRSKSEKVGRDDFINGNAQFFYVDYYELTRLNG